MTATLALTGGTGFIGRAIAERLLTKGWSVTALVRNEDRGLAEAGATTLRGSLEDRDALARLLADAEAVVHCAGVVAAGDRRVFDEVNAQGTARLAAAAAAAPGKPRLLLISSLAAREPGLSPRTRRAHHSPEPFPSADRSRRR